MQPETKDNHSNHDMNDDNCASCPHQINGVALCKYIQNQCDQYDPLYINEVLEAAKLAQERTELIIQKAKEELDHLQNELNITDPQEGQTTEA